MMRRLLAVGALLAAAGALAVLLVTRHHPRRSEGRAQVIVLVDGRPHAFPPPVVLAAAVRRLGLRPAAGDLVDVAGHVLRRHVYAGQILVDGRRARASQRLHDGDRITLRAGRDRRERVVRERVGVPGGMPPPVESVLSRIPTDAIVSRGAISHRLVRTALRPAGPAATLPAVALTFDDGPSPAYTPRILAILERFHVPATFFAVGYLVDAYPELIDDELRVGMQVGNHTYNHPEVPPFDRLPPLLRDAEITLGIESLRRAGGDPALLRPPAGSTSPAVVSAAERTRERIVLWSVDPVDWQPGATAAQIVSRVLAATRPGSIILLHDGGGDRSATVRALPAIIRGIRRRGLPFVQP